FYHTRPDRAPLESWTDSRGRYSLRTWYEEHAIAASAPGYQTQLSTLVTKPFGRESIARLDFQMLPSGIPAATTPQASSLGTPFYIGQAWFPKHDLIEITSLTRTGDEMTVQGHYQLASADRALLALYIATTNAVHTPENPEGILEISKGAGDFRLSRTHLVPGLPHLSMYADGKPFAALYFGTRAEARAERELNLDRETPATVGIGIPLSLFQIRLVAPEGSTAPTDSFKEIPGQRPLAVLREVLLDNSDVAQAGTEFSTTGRSIRIGLTPEGTRRFATLTATNLNRQLAVIVLGKVLAAPIIRTKIPGGQIVIGTGLSATDSASILDMLNRSPVRSADEWTFRAPREITLLALHPVAFSDSRSPVGPLDHLRGWLDLDTGVAVTNQPRGWTTWIDHDWIRTNGLDLVAAVSSDQLPVLMGFDMVVERMPADSWDSLTAADVVQSWSLMQTRSQPMQNFGLAPGQSDTFIFLTAEGGRGVLQILGLTRDSHSVKLRYKLVRSNTRAGGAERRQ
ncbi:MAG: hypothetical protein KGS61_20145, partial [Verrucomicrobia bacterium]|nr:hypothetical protein [Verrucomicrobiota bacterium]